MNNKSSSEIFLDKGFSKIRLSGKILSTIMVSAVVSGLSTTVQSAGFALIENSASGMGNSFAGGAAIAEDSSTVWFNPAGMTKLSGDQIVVAGHIIIPGADFTNNGSMDGATPAVALSGNDDDGGATGFVPNFYYTTELGDGNFFGVGVTVPFGLATEYDHGWRGRYTATKSEVSTININPSFASKATDKLSVGFGFNIQYIEATLANHLDSAYICDVTLSGAGGACGFSGLTNAEIGDRSLDSMQSLSGDDLNVGWNVGLLYEFDSSSRLGLAYRSSIKHNLKGDVDFTMSTQLAGAVGLLPGALDTLFSDTGIHAELELPETLSVSYFQDVDSKLSMMADATWTRWSNFENLTIVFDNPVQSDSVTPEGWENNLRLSIGASYKSDSALIYRVGLALDKTPIKSAELRTPRIPGHDRKWLSFGVGYKLASDMSLDVGYSHLFVSDTNINNFDESSGSTLIGSYEADVDILSAQMNFDF